jgi:hypothetical protein
LELVRHWPPPAAGCHCRCPEKPPIVREQPARGRAPQFDRRAAGPPERGRCSDAAVRTGDAGFGGLALSFVLGGQDEIRCRHGEVDREPACADEAAAGYCAARVHAARGVARSAAPLALPAATKAGAHQGVRFALCPVPNPHGVLESSGALATPCCGGLATQSALERAESQQRTCLDRGAVPCGPLVIAHCAPTGRAVRR